jgi:glycosyltransferase involved in cell wall biosynthesis
MHVLIVTPVYPHPASPTEGLFNQQHAQSLVRAGVKATVLICKPWLPAVVANRWERYRALTCLDDFEEPEGVRVMFVRYLHIPRYRLYPLTLASCSRSILGKIRAMTSQALFDVIQVHSSWPVGMATPIVADALRCPFVITMHIEDDVRLVSRQTGSALYKRMLEKASAVVVVGRPLERFLQQWFLDVANGQLRIIPNGVDLKMIQEVVETSGKKGGAGKHIVSVANLWPTKGIDANLRALKELNRLGMRWDSYTVVGDGPERRRLEKLARELDIADKVQFKGRLSHRDALSEIARADIFSLPSWQEAFGVAYLEAMACGKPVIGCYGQGAEDIVRHGIDGLLVKCGDLEDLTSAMKQLVGSSEYSCRLGESAMSRAREFTWERNSKEYLKVYQDICSQSADSSRSRNGQRALQQ